MVNLEARHSHELAGDRSGVRDRLTSISFIASSLFKSDVAAKYDVQLEARNLQRHRCGK